jgi:ubiquinone/menaquinone biosynthesis C-methylase UbiE
MAGWFRKGLSRHHTAIAMIGSKPGDQVLVVGASDPELAAEVALVTGLNGSTTVCDPDASARARVEAAARAAGALVEFATAPPASLPAADESQDVVVLMNTAHAVAHMDPAVVLEHALRVLRPGGRVIVVDGIRTSGFFRSSGGAARLPAETILTRLEQGGTRARRQLAEVDGVSYYEARK